MWFKFKPLIPFPMNFLTSYHWIWISSEQLPPYYTAWEWSPKEIVCKNTFLSFLNYSFLVHKNTFTNKALCNHATIKQICSMDNCMIDAARFKWINLAFYNFYDMKSTVKLSVHILTMCDCNKPGMHIFNCLIIIQNQCCASILLFRPSLN